MTATAEQLRGVGGRFERQQEATRVGAVSWSFVPVYQHENASTLSLASQAAKNKPWPQLPIRPTLEQLKELGAGRPAPAEVVRLYRQAFCEFGTQALWSRRPSDALTIAQALVIAEGMRREGNLNSRVVAVAIERAVPLSKIQRDILRLLAAQR